MFELDGSYAKDAEIEVAILPAGSISHAGKRTVFTDETNAAGQFRAEGLEEGHYAVVATSENARGLEIVRLGNGAVHAAVTLVLLPGKPLVGAVVDERGQGIPNAQLVPLFHDGQELRRSQSRARVVLTDSSGAFAFDCIEPRAWEIYVTAEGFAPLLTSPMLAGSTDNVVVLSTGSTLRGVLVDDTTDLPLGKIPISAARVGLDVDPLKCVTDANGEFSFALDNAAYFIDIDNPPLVLLDGPVEVQARPFEELPPLLLRASHGGTLRGIVVDNESSAPVAMAELRAFTAGHIRPQRFVRSDEEGNFELTGVPPGEVSIEVTSAPGFPNAVRTHKPVHAVV